MAKVSQYNKELKEKQNKKIDQLLKLLPVYIAPFVHDKELSVQPNTVIAYERDLLTFLEFLCSQNPMLKGKKPKEVPEAIIEKLTFEDINEYQRYLNYYDGKDTEKSHSNEERAICRKMAALRGFFKYGCTHGILKNDPTIGAAKRKKTQKKEIVRMNSKEAATLISYAENSIAPTKRGKIFAEKAKLRDTAILTLLLNTGIRVSECVGIDLDDINFEKGSVRIVRKGGNESVVYMNEQTSAALREYMDLERNQYLQSDKEQALFLSSQKKRLSVRSIEYIVKKYARQAVPDKHITPHKCRSTYGTLLYQATSDIKLVADTLGHTDVNVSSSYYINSSEEHRRLAAKVKVYDPDGK